MGSEIQTRLLAIKGMTCVNCKTRIERKLRNMPGVESVQVSYSEKSLCISYDGSVISPEDICACLETLGYQAFTDGEKQGPDLRRAAGVLVLIVSLYLLLQQTGILNRLVPGRLADGEMGYGMLFVLGLMTSVHCIAMCGGINLSQSISGKEMSSFRPSLLYNLGRVLSYTAVGGVLGLAGLISGGNAGAGFSALFQGMLKIAAGVLMVLMGVNMLGIFPWLSRWQPRIPGLFARTGSCEKQKNKGPLIVGLMNGFLPCGPLQSMQIVALASGNPLSGALSMLLFSLGTVPLMLGFGSAASVLGRKFHQRVMGAGAVLVVVLGLAMVSQGAFLSGLLSPDTLLILILAFCAVGLLSCIPFKNPVYKKLLAALSLGVAVTAAAMVYSRQASGSQGQTSGGVLTEEGKQVVNSTLSSGSYPAITVEAGIPVKWVIDAPQGSINGCNYRINIPEYGIFNYSFQTGENVIEFTPEEMGRFSYSCWMGMIRGTITVIQGEGAKRENGGL